MVFLCSADFSHLPSVARRRPVIAGVVRPTFHRPWNRHQRVDISTPGSSSSPFHGVGAWRVHSPLMSSSVQRAGEYFFPAPNSELEKIPLRIKNLTLELLEEFPQYVTEMVHHCDLDLLSFTHIRYRSPWNLLTENLWSGTTTVVGDVMHVMGLFLGQGGSAAMEDAVVLARCLARELGNRDASSDRELKERVVISLSRYVKERRMRLVKLAV